MTWERYLQTAKGAAGLSQVPVSSSTTNLCNSPCTNPRALFKHFGHTVLSPPIVYRFLHQKTSKSRTTATVQLTLNPLCVLQETSASITLLPVLSHQFIEIWELRYLWLFSEEESISRHFCWFPGPQKEPACPWSLLLVPQTTHALARLYASTHSPPLASVFKTGWNAATES